jgi:hypothetical protein
MSDDEKKDLFLMMLQGPAADWVSGWLEGAVYTPSYHSLKKAFEENYYKAKNSNGKTRARCGTKSKEVLNPFLSISFE